MSRKFHLPIIVSAIFLLAFSSSSPAKNDKSDFSMPPVHSFQDGKLDAVQLGVTTASDLKEHYKIAKRGNTIPWSLMVSTPKGSGYKFNVLFGGNNDHKDTATAIFIRYESGPTLDAVKQEFGEIGKPYYQTGRSSDWLIYAYAKQGVIAFVDKQSVGKVVFAVLLLPTEAAKTACANLSPTFTRIAPVTDPHAGEPRIMYFGSVDVTTTLDGLSMSDTEKSNLRDELRRATAGGAMRFMSYAPGRCSADIHGSYKNDKGGSLEMTVSIDGNSPYGAIHASGSSSTIYQAHTDIGGSANYTFVELDALTKAEQDFAAQMRAAGPPSPDALRRKAWDDIFNQCRAAGANAQGIHATVPTAFPFTQAP